MVKAAVRSLWDKFQDLPSADTVSRVTHALLHGWKRAFVYPILKTLDPLVSETVLASKESVDAGG